MNSNNLWISEAPNNEALWWVRELERLKSQIMNQGNSSKQCVSLPKLHQQCSPLFTEVELQLLVLNCLNLGYSGSSTFSLIYPQLEWLGTIDFFQCTKRRKKDCDIKNKILENQGLIYERQNATNFRCKHRDYLYDLGKISSSKHKTCKSQKKRLGNLTLLWTSLSCSY